MQEDMKGNMYVRVDASSFTDRSITKQKDSPTFTSIPT